MTEVSRDMMGGWIGSCLC